MMDHTIALKQQLLVNPFFLSFCKNALRYVQLTVQLASLSRRVSLVISLQDDPEASLTNVESASLHQLYKWQDWTIQ